MTLKEIKAEIARRCKWGHVAVRTTNIVGEKVFVVFSLADGAWLAQSKSEKTAWQCALDWYNHGNVPAFYFGYDIPRPPRQGYSSQKACLKEHWDNHNK